MKVVVALSGGVDSAVAAGILKGEGHEVVGVHMQNWDRALNEGEDGCMAHEEYRDVEEICRILGIELRVYNFVAEYWEKVFCPYIEDLRNNLNTNPDIGCNVHIKFGVLMERIREEFGNVMVATGHWARVIRKGNRCYLGMCKNERKDQTYFLSGLKEHQLKSVIFPLGEIENKGRVRELAKEMGFGVWNKRDSTGICFVGKRKYREFIGKYIEEKKGKMIDVETGMVIGEHGGTHLYVMHQRGGFGLKGYGDRYYVCGKDEEKNVLYMCRESVLDKYLCGDRTRCERISWISRDNGVKLGERVHIRARHGGELMEVVVEEVGEDYVVLGHDRKYVTSPGQAVVFYRGDICLGKGIYVKC